MPISISSGTSSGNAVRIAGSDGNDIYIWGVGDEYDVINEQGNGDNADILNITNFPTINRIDEDFKFRMQGDDLLIDLRLDGEALESTLRIKNQTIASSQVETMIIRGVRIDLTDLVNQVSLGVDTFATTGTSSANGALVVPV